MNSQAAQGCEKEESEEKVKWERLSLGSGILPTLSFLEVAGRHCPLGHRNLICQIDSFLALALFLTVSLPLPSLHQLFFLLCQKHLLYYQLSFLHLQLLLQPISVEREVEISLFLLNGSYWPSGESMAFWGKHSLLGDVVP